MDNKKKYASLILLVFAVVVVTISASFAFFSYSREGVVNVLQMGNIEFAMLDGDNVLITNAFPQSDDEGNLNEAYSFTVKNTSSEGFDIYYNLLFLDNNKESDVNYFSNGQIKYSLVKNGVYAAKTSSTSGNKLSSINGFTIGGTTGEGVVLSKQLIKAGETDSYNLRIWISDDVDYSTEESNGLVTGAYNEYMYSLKVKIETTSGEVTYGPGLYNSSDEIVYDWQELLDNGFISVSDGALKIENAGRGNLTSKLVVDSSVTEISSSGFIGESSLKEIILPEGFTKIGASAFQGTVNLETVVFPSTLKEISYSAFDHSGITNIELSGVEFIRNGAFSNTNRLESVDFGNSPVIIETAAFSTSAVKSVTGNNILEIGNTAFENSSNLTSINLGDKITSIDIGAFRKTALTELVIPSSVTSIGNSILTGTNTVTKIDCYANIKYNSDTFYDTFGDMSSNAIVNTINVYNGKIGGSAFQYLTNLKNVYIGSGVTEIGYGAFSNNTSISNVTFDNNLIKTIEGNTFYGCTSLNEMVLPSSIETIANDAFSRCSNLDLTVPDSVTSIGAIAFSGVKHITYNGSATGSPWGALSIN